MLSEKRSYDRFTKRMVYADAGACEYWVVDRARDLVEVFHGYDLVAQSSDTLTSELLPGFALDVKALFAD